MHCIDVRVLSLMRCCHKKHMGSNKQVQYVVTQTSLTKSGSNMISQTCECWWHMFNIPEVICYNRDDLPCALPVLLVPISTSFPPVLGHIKQFFFLGKEFITGWAVCPTTYSDLSTIWLTLLWTHPWDLSWLLQHTCTPWHSFMSWFHSQQCPSLPLDMPRLILQFLSFVLYNIFGDYSPSPTAYIIYFI